jgi:hypothetical protein
MLRIRRVRVYPYVPSQFLAPDMLGEDARRHLERLETLRSFQKHAADTGSPQVMGEWPLGPPRKAPGCDHSVARCIWHPNVFSLSSRVCATQLP